LIDKEVAELITMRQCIVQGLHWFSGDDTCTDC